MCIRDRCIIAFMLSLKGPSPAAWMLAIAQLTLSFICVIMKDASTFQLADGDAIAIIKMLMNTPRINNVIASVIIVANCVLQCLPTLPAFGLIEFVRVLHLALQMSLANIIANCFLVEARLLRSRLRRLENQLLLFRGLAEKTGEGLCLLDSRNLDTVFANTAIARVLNMDRCCSDDVMESLGMMSVVELLESESSHMITHGGRNQKGWLHAIREYVERRLVPDEGSNHDQLSIERAFSVATVLRELSHICLLYTSPSPRDQA
eukprot:TRINITY_DN9754_c0_g1_i5.p1 TRINITY_DN9754_c0_g1~~TRINITY_DN9754_c0_g1_i5.p1  ORF type:complete len:263 (-),score=22.48 TRINITY_DN9754_c0_g1_i5:116-904(-)